MKTIVYISRHSQPMKPNFDKSNDCLQLQNEKQTLSAEGERRAKILSEIDELKDIDVVISSNYVRAIATAKYVADKNNKEIYVMDDFGERRFGVDSWSEIDRDYYERQYEDENYKTLNGESQKEVRIRMHKALMGVIKNHTGKKILIVSHATAMSFLFATWCKLKLSDPINKIRQFYFEDKLIFDGNFFAPELFKLEFEDKELINIENIKVAYIK